MGKKQRNKEKKDNKLLEKTIEQRTEEINVIRDKISLLGLTADLSKITNIFELMDEYINKNIPMSGTINLEGYNKKIVYAFPKSKNLKPWLNILNN